MESGSAVLGFSADYFLKIMILAAIIDVSL